MINSDRLERNDTGGLSTNLGQWKTITTFVVDNTEYTENQMGWLLRHRKDNGLDKVTRKIGKRIYINEALFADWMMHHEQ